MYKYLITYDLIKRKNYPELINELKKYSKRWHCLGSAWIIETNENINELIDKLILHIDADDKLIVLEVGPSVAWTESFSKDCQSWLQNNFD